MSRQSIPTRCPKCGNSDITLIGTLEANEFSDGHPLTDLGVYQCRSCFEEWEQ